MKQQGRLERLHKRKMHLARMRRQYGLSEDEIVHFVNELAPQIAELPADQRQVVLDALVEKPVDPDVRSAMQADWALGQIQRDPDMKYPTGIISQVVDDMTPGGQGLWRTTAEMADTVIKTGRIAPFVKIDVDDMCDWAKVDEKELREVNREIHSEQVQGGLMDRMGTDSDRPDEPLSLRETISASVDHHEGPTGGSNDG